MALAHDILINHDQLADLIRRGIDRAGRQDRSILVSYTERIPAPDPLDLFAAARATDQIGFFWQQPDHGFAIVGVGAAWTIERNGSDRFDGIIDLWRDLIGAALIEGMDTMAGSGPTLLGGFSFDPQCDRTELWRDFADASLVLPRLQLTLNDGVAALTFNMLVDRSSDPNAVADDLAQLAADLLSDPLPSSSRSSQLTISNTLPGDEWKAIVADGIDTIRSGALEKVVLARSVEVIGSRPIDPIAALDRLRQSYPSAYVFAITRGDRCFMGATPERLVGVRSGVVKASGLAGTTQRGATEDEDRQLGRALLHSAKERHEHAVVVDMLREALNAVCVDVYAPAAPRLLKLPNVQHLYTPISGRLQPGYSLIDLVAALHPTPAVGGLPRPDAIAFIRDHEQLDRGWFAAPVGWLDARGEGDFAVALRSGLIDGERATLFAGVGVVADSDPAKEYVETQLKLRPMLTGLGVALTPVADATVPSPKLGEGLEVRAT